MSKRQRRWVGFGLLGAIAVLLATSLRAHALEFPELRPSAQLPAGFAWRLENDVEDFYIYRATKSGAELPIVGIYFGLHPSFHGGGGSPQAGTVAGHPVSWYASTKNGTLYQECLLPYHHSPNHIALKLHIWILGRNEKEVQVMKEVLKALTFEESSPRGKN